LAITVVLHASQKETKPFAHTAEQSVVSIDPSLPPHAAMTLRSRVVADWPPAALNVFAESWGTRPW